MPYSTLPHSHTSTPASSTLNRSAASLQTDHSSLRLAEKHFKSRANRCLPSLLGLPSFCRPVLDLSRPAQKPHQHGLNHEETREGEKEEDEVWKAGWWGNGQLGKIRRGQCRLDQKSGAELPYDVGQRPPMSWEEQGVRKIDVAGRPGYVITNGIIIIPSYLDQEAQLSLLRNCLAKYTRPPNPLSISTHYLVPPNLFELYARDTTSSPNNPLIPRQGKVSCAQDTGDGKLPTMVSPRHSLLRDDQRAAIEMATENNVRGRRVRIDTPPDAIGRLSATVQGQHSRSKQRYECQYLAEEKEGMETVKTPGMGLMSLKVEEKTVEALMKELRWANLGHIYNWTTKTYDFSLPSPRFPPEVAKLCQNVLKDLPWSSFMPDSENSSSSTSSNVPLYWNDYLPDTGIINYYQLPDTLMCHVDRSELDPSRPLISLSLGHACILLLGTASRDDPPIPLILRSGDVLVMYNEGRQCYHGVPRIMEGTLPRWFEEKEGDDELMKASKRWIRTARVNVNVREVFPPGHPMRERVKSLDETTLHSQEQRVKIGYEKSEDI